MPRILGKPALQAAIHEVRCVLARDDDEQQERAWDRLNAIVDHMEAQDLEITRLWEHVEVMTRIQVES